MDNTVTRIWGREPATILSAFYMLVSLMGAFVFGWNDFQQALVNTVGACVMALILAVTIQKDALFAAVVNVCKAILAAAFGFGWHVSADKQALLMSSVSVLVSVVIVRPNVEAPVAAKPTKKQTETFPGK